jgi:hypothetical protein
LGQSNAGAHGTYKKRFAVRRKTSTDPDVTTTAVMLSKIRVIQRRAYGLRDQEYLRLKVLTCMLPAL